MTSAIIERQTPRPARPARLIAVMPAYNEEATIEGVLDRLEPLVDEIVIVDDGSTDGTTQAIFNWTSGRPHAHPVFFNHNRGMSAAYYEAFQEIGRRVRRGELSADDIILTIDADGQHKPEDIDALVSRLSADGLAAVVARRDLSRYPVYKRLGNWLMSWWATLWAGRRLYDVESGFRVFRVGPLLDALRYYRGYRYSETVEVAVILPHLGYGIANDVLLPVPVMRSRTRLKDAAIDFFAMPAAWWRAYTARNAPRDMPSWSVYVVPALVFLGLLFIIVDLLIRPVFLGDDSVHNYAHVWYISQQLFDHARIPLRISLLDSGRAVTFPYGFVPYLAGAVLMRGLGDWSVTFLMVVAVLGTVWTAGLVRPAVRDPWLLLIFVINPFFIDAVYAFQFATLWSVLFFFLFVWTFERRRYVPAAVLLWLTISTHPIMGGLAAVTYGAWILARDRPRLKPLLIMSVPVGLALIPIFWMMLLTPSVRENGLRTVVLSVLDVVPRRGSLYAMPFLLAVAAPYIRSYYRATLAMALTAAGLGILFSAGVVNWHHGSYYGAIHGTSDVYGAFFRSASFQPGATYRVMEPNEREDGMYRFMQHGAVLSNEFFSESIFRRNWSEPQYGCYTAFKGVDFVVTERAYQKEYHRNEQDLLNSLVGQRRAGLTYADPAGRFSVYDIRPFVAEQTKPSSLDACNMY